MKIIFAVLLAGIAVTAADPAWNDLSGTFGTGGGMAFAQFPRSTRDPLFTSENWIPTTPGGNNCTNGGLFNGIQYTKGGDLSVGILMDIKGTFAGIQMLIPHSLVLKEGNPVRYDLVKMYQNATYNGEKYFVITAYTVDPTTICTMGRDQSDLDTVGTGTGIWIQNGPGPSSFLQVPYIRHEGDEAVRSGWTQNNCFMMMGLHNFYRQDTYDSTQCRQLDPFFALYSKDKRLHGFGFITPGNIDNPRFEHPPPQVIEIILGNTPQCIFDLMENVGITSLHVYFITGPTQLACPSTKMSDPIMFQNFS